MADTTIAGGRSASPVSEPHRLRHTVLPIEDNRDNREIYALYLTHRGFVVLTAADAETGLQLAADQAPNLVLMMKATPATADIPVVALTAHAMASDRALALNAGCDLYLSKPLDPAALGAELRRFLGT